MSDKPYTYDPSRSYLLDTDTKVEWANQKAPKVGDREYRLGDHCYYRPLTPIIEPSPIGYGGWECG